LYFVAITNNPKDTVTAVGSNITLKCVAFGVDRIMYKWMRKGMKTIPSTATGGNTSKLIIDNIAFVDGGEYRCTVSSGNVNVNSEYATLTIWGKFVSLYNIYI